MANVWLIMSAILVAVAMSMTILLMCVVMWLLSLIIQCVVASNAAQCAMAGREATAGWPMAGQLRKLALSVAFSLK